ncbi:MAG: virulence protein RhuM/Fic/DOC family protein [Phascolarctobacterium sp.]|nr:virulence protein RhuM/Fic/DOC family protein [Phascolarctobacterium sp.]
MENMGKELITFTDNGLELAVTVTPEKETVWLTQAQMSELFDTARSSIAYHIGKIFAEKELDKNTSVEIFDRSINSRPPKFYNLDVIISVGYRVKSQRGVVFRKWATSVLKEYLQKGYAVNEKRLQALQKTVEIESRIIAGMANLDAGDVLRVVNEYEAAFMLLDDYDHQCVTKPKGNLATYRLQYQECKELISKMEFSKESAIFGTEKEVGKLEGIISAIYQSAFGKDVYPSVEEKAANLLYFIVKDHPFNDGCKRIAAALFLFFLSKNSMLIESNGNKLLSKSALVAITLMVAESRAEEKDIIVKVIMNFLQWK